MALVTKILPLEQSIHQSKSHGRRVGSVLVWKERKSDYNGFHRSAHLIVGIRLVSCLFTLTMGLYGCKSTLELIDTSPDMRIWNVFTEGWDTCMIEYSCMLDFLFFIVAVWVIMS
jgi:hypothetical protein